MLTLYRIINTIVLFLIVASISTIFGVGLTLWVLSQHSDQACQMAQSKSIIKDWFDGK